MNNLPGNSHAVLPDGFDGTPPSENERVTAFCGGCQYFDGHPLGGGGDCQKGHDPRKQAARDHCPDRVLMPVSGGPQFDMSE